MRSPWNPSVREKGRGTRNTHKYRVGTHTRKFSKRNKGYMFHTELNLNDGDGRTALLGSCPEVVRVENWLQ